MLESVVGGANSCWKRRVGGKAGWDTEHVPSNCEASEKLIHTFISSHSQSIRCIEGKAKNNVLKMQLLDQIVFLPLLTSQFLIIL